MFRKKQKKSVKDFIKKRNQEICKVFLNLLQKGYSTNKSLIEIGIIHSLTPEGVKKIIKKNGLYKTTGHIKKKEVVNE